ncbi:TPA: hypothetical protein ACSP31_003194 [Aeromonas veronii]
MTEQAKTDTAQTQLVVIEPTTAVALFTEGQGIDEDKAINLIKQIAGNKIEHLSINY